MPDMRRVLVPTHIARADPAFGGVVHALAGQTMGTTWSVKLVSSRDAQATGAVAAWRRGIAQRLAVVVSQMSTWDDTSDLCRFNRAPAGSWHEPPPEFFDVLQHGLYIARATSGAYDPTQGALVDLWGFGPHGSCRDAGFVLPGDAAIDIARARGGWERLGVDIANRRVQQPGGLSLDLSAIAKGFGVDEAARYLQSQGLDSFLVEVGGELRGEGVKPDGQPWWVSLETPTDAAAARLNETVIALHGLSVATSGDYRKFVDIGGARYSHTLDPRDGRPIRHGVASVSVLHADAMAADAWSTALNVLGAELGTALADAHGLPTLFLIRTADGFEERASQALLALMQ
jgi:thiamine biosynthesis lipoprotein